MRAPVPALSLLQPFETPAVCSLSRADSRGLGRSQKKAYGGPEAAPPGTQRETAGTRRARPGGGCGHSPYGDRHPLASPAGCVTVGRGG